MSQAQYIMQNYSASGKSYVTEKMNDTAEFWMTNCSFVPSIYRQCEGLSNGKPILFFNKKFFQNPDPILYVSQAFVGL